MKILFIAVFNETSTNNSQATAFEKLGHEVIRYNYRERAKEMGNLARDMEIIETCENAKPNLVLFSKCNGVHYDVIEECNKISNTALWFMDFISMSWDKELENKISRCTFSCFGIRKAFELAKKTYDNIYFIHEGFDEFCNYPINPAILSAEIKYDVAFIGNMREERIPFYNYRNFNIIDNAYEIEHSKIVGRSKINLNFTLGEGTSDRTYKVLASKGFLLTQPWTDMELDFAVGKDFDIFNTPKEMKEKIDYYLSRENDRLNIANHGYHTVQKFTRTKWAEEILRINEQYR